MPGKRPDPTELARTHWDLIVIGGGITGAGTLLMAARLGLKVLLVEQRDFAWGTSSRSSKMVHGGLRYIAQGDIGLTRDALRERERLIRELPELVVRQDYLFPIRRKRFPGRWSMKLLLWFYDRLAGIRDHRWLNRSAVLERLPGFEQTGLKGAMTYTDALTDDSRLVLRILHEGTAEGGAVCNYLTADSVTAADTGFRVRVTDGCDDSTHELRTERVINATGAWADRLSGSEARIRPLRGSHLFVARERLPVDDCLTILHPEDGRPVFIFPWEGATCIGTTDLDHDKNLDEEPRCSRRELDYLLKLANSQFPELQLGPSDVISTWAGVRPVISSGKGLDPSQERREHAVWTNDNGVITVSGGKLTTFRLIALDALEAAGLLDAEGRRKHGRDRTPLFSPRELHPGGGHPLRDWPELTDTGWVEWILEHEMVVHLDDLLLRRTHLGLLRPRGARDQLEALREPCQRLLGWNDERWAREVERYLALIEDYYSVPGGTE